MDVFSGASLLQIDATNEVIDGAVYTVTLRSSRGERIILREDETGIILERDGHLTGLTDGRQHPIYQTKWMKFVLRRLGLADDFRVPECEDSYASLCWWDKEDIHLPAAWAFENTQDYPYLTWAEAHFRKAPPPLHLAGTGFPLTWESRASEAPYAGMDCIVPSYTANRICMPHTWHATEMFLYLVECEGYHQED